MKLKIPKLTDFLHIIYALFGISSSKFPVIKIKQPIKILLVEDITAKQTSNDHFYREIDELKRLLFPYEKRGYFEVKVLRQQYVSHNNLKEGINGCHIAHFATHVQDIKYIFSWDEVPGDDNDRLIEFIKQSFGIDWVKTAKIEKVDDGKTIKVYTEKNSLSLRLNDEKTKVSLTISDGWACEFIVKKESDKKSDTLNIYYKTNQHILVYDDNTKEKTEFTTETVKGIEQVPDVVFMNGCYSGEPGGFSDAFIKKENGTKTKLFVGSYYAITSPIAATCALWFYQHLIFDGFPAGEALLETREDIREFYKEYLFSWDQIPGNDNDRLIEFIKQSFGIDWVKTAKIEKIDDSKTIKVYTEKNSLSLRLNDEKTKVNLKIDDGRTDEFIVKMENDKLNIYNDKYGERIYAHIPYVLHGNPATRLLISGRFLKARSIV